MCALLNLLHSHFPLSLIRCLIHKSLILRILQHSLVIKEPLILQSSKILNYGLIYLCIIIQAYLNLLEVHEA